MLSFRVASLSIALLCLPASVAAQDQDIALPQGAYQIVYGAGRNRFAGATFEQGLLTGLAERPDLVIGSPGNGGVGFGSAYVFIDGGGRSPREAPAGSIAQQFSLTPNSNFGNQGRLLAVGHLSTAGTGPPNLVIAGFRDVSIFGPGLSRGFQSGHTRFNNILSTALGVADLDDDGYDDLLVGTDTQIHIVRGGTRLATAIAGGGSTDFPAWPPEVTMNVPGPAIAIAGGDVTADGIDDILIGIPTQNVVYLIKGGHPLAATMNLPADADAVFTGVNAGDEAGHMIRMADIDGDGIRDAIIGAPSGDGPDESRMNAGETYILWGGAGLASRSLSLADVTIYDQMAHRLGTYITAGDLNRDPRADLVFVSPGAGGGKGEAHVFYGRTRNTIGMDIGSGRRMVDFHDGPDRNILGVSASAPLATAIIFNRTGGEDAADIIIGAPTFDGTICYTSCTFETDPGVVYFTQSPTLAMTPASIAQTLVQGQTASTTVTVSNASEVALTWAVSVDQPWLSTSGATGSAMSDSSGQFVLTRSTTGLAPGTYTGTVTLTSTSIHLVSSRTLVVSLTVLAPGSQTPENAKNDFNADAKMDILWQDRAEGYIAAWTMNGLTLQSSDLLSPGRVSDTSWRIVGTGDVNGDGRPDIFWQDETRGYLAVWTMNGLSLISSDLLMPAAVGDTNWKIVGIADLDRDNKPDIIWREQTEGWIGVWLMDGLTLRTSIALSPERVPDTNWQIVGTGDLNQDSRSDLLWRHRTEGWLAVWLMDGTTLIDSLLLSPARVADQAWHIAAAGDLDGDGKCDLVWQEENFGWLVAWLMNGLELRASVDVSPNRVSQLNWKIAGPK